MNTIVMSEKQMLEQITTDIRELRARMNTYIDDHAERSIKVAEDIAKIREDMAGHKGRLETKISMLAAGVSVIVTGVTAWVVKHWGA